MKVESLLLFLLALRYAFETKPLQYAILSGLLEQYPNMLPEGARTPLEIVRVIDTVLYTRQNEEDALSRSVQSLRTFASRFG